jgi:hypothetical protein
VTTPTFERYFSTEWPELLVPSNAVVFSGTSGRIVGYSSEGSVPRRQREAESSAVRA